MELVLEPASSLEQQKIIYMLGKRITGKFKVFEVLVGDL